MQVLEEGTKFGGFIKNIATGDIDKEVAELKKEARSIHTPEDKSIILNKTIKLLHKAIVIRHNWPSTKKYIYGLGSWFDKIFTKKNSKPEVEINDKIKLIIADLSKLRDKILDTEVRGEAESKAVLARVKKLRTDAENSKLNDDDF